MSGRTAVGSDPEWLDGAGYDAYVGTWSRALALEFTGWLDAPPQARWLDVGCGTGALSGVVLSVAGPSGVVGVDSATEYVAIAQGAIDDPRASFSVADGMQLPFDEASFDIVISGLVLNFVPDPAGAVAEQVRVVRRGALVAAYVWDYADGLEFLRTFWSVATELHRSATAYEREATFPIAVRGPLEALFDEAGISGIETRPIEIETTFGSFEELWGRFLGAQRLRRGEEPVWKGPSYDLLVALDEKTRSRIREMYRQRLPVAADGSVALQARAWAIRGTTPL